MEGLRPFEKVGYALGDTASNLFWKTFEFFLLFFYTEVFGISPAVAATMLLVTRAWDAFIDPVMGVVADRTNTRWGKFRPYLLWFALPIGAAAVLTFTTPDLGTGGKVVWAYVTYTLLMVLYTIINIPYSALMGVMTPSSAERTSLSSYRFVGAFSGAVFVQYFTLKLVKIFGGENQARGWQLTMVLYGALAAVLFLASFATTRERVTPPKEQRANLKQEVRDLGTNGPWMVMFVLGLLVIVSFWLRGATFAYYFRYCVKREDMLGWFLSTGGAASIAGIACTATLSRWIGKRRLYQILMATAGVLTIAYYWIDPTNLPLVFGVNLAICAILGPTAPLVWAMYADTADYQEWKTGRRATGLVFAAASLAQKLGGALGGWIAGTLLAYFGYQANVPQTVEAQFGIRLMISLLPGTTCILAAFALIAYRLDDSFMKKIEDELIARRAASKEREVAISEPAPATAMAIEGA